MRSLKYMFALFIFTSSWSYAAGDLVGVYTGNKLNRPLQKCKVEVSYDGTSYTFTLFNHKQKGWNALGLTTIREATVLDAIAAEDSAKTSAFEERNSNGQAISGGAIDFEGKKLSSVYLWGEHTGYTCKLRWTPKTGQ